MDDIYDIYEVGTLFKKKLYSMFRINLEVINIFSSILDEISKFENGVEILKYNTNIYVSSYSYLTIEIYNLQYPYNLRKKFKNLIIKFQLHRLNSKDIKLDVYSSEIKYDKTNDILIDFINIVKIYPRDLLNVDHIIEKDRQYKYRVTNSLAYNIKQGINVNLKQHFIIFLLKRRYNMNNINELFNREGIIKHKDLTLDQFDNLLAIMNIP